ncbi:TPR domain protein [Acidisarcina polymorpha]|uniref:TPR domain protein n=2 Tax=Acidisarcina polymorpha TaxID=2211140 RepID=A0A2Z5FYC0_9BACT|nr:TPR domain protein [Acidisarcina polymorpha]
MIRLGIRGSLLLMLVGISAYGVCQSSSATEQVEAHIREAHRLLSENRPAEAVPEFEAVVALDPANVDARGNLGVLLFFEKNYAAAIPQLREALRLKPDLWKIQALLGMAEHRSGDNAAARSDLEKSLPELQEKKIRIEAGLELVELDSASDDLEKAAAVVSTLLALDPENPQLLYTAYQIHSDLARQAILSLSLVAPKSALMYQAAAHEAARRGDTASAIVHYREALKIDPKLPGLHFELAEMLSSLPATAASSVEAKSEYEAALAQNSFDERAELRLAEIAMQANDQTKAYAFGARALQLQPDDAEANYEVAKMLLAMDQPAKAEPLLEHAVRLDPTNAVIHFRLSTVYHRLGRNVDAEREVQEYHKYKDLKEHLRVTWKELQLNPEKQGVFESKIEK